MGYIMRNPDHLFSRLLKDWSKLTSENTHCNKTCNACGRAAISQTQNTSSLLPRYLLPVTSKGLGQLPSSHSSGWSFKKLCEKSIRVSKYFAPCKTPNRRRRYNWLPSCNCTCFTYWDRCYSVTLPNNNQKNMGKKNHSNRLQFFCYFTYFRVCGFGIFSKRRIFHSKSSRIVQISTKKKKVQNCFCFFFSAT